MLTHLSIRDVVLVESLDLEFDRGLTVFTGETGVGKSIILDALCLALGARADAGLIREKAERLSVAASFLLPAGHSVLQVSAEHGMGGDDGTVVLRRVIGRDGRGRAFINDQPAGVALLKAIGGMLVEAHGQFDTHGLLHPATHLDVLDTFRGTTTDGENCASCYASWREAQARLAEFKERLAKSLGDSDYVAAVVEELSALAPVAGEGTVLAERRATLKNVDQIRGALVHAKQALNSDADIEAALRSAAARIARANSMSGGRLDAAAAALDRAIIEVSEAINAVDHAAESLDAEPAALEKVDERLFQLRSAARKHRCAVDDLPAVKSRFEKQLIELQDSSARTSELAAAVDVSKGGFERAACALHRARVDAGEKLDRAVAKELPPLKLEKAQFRTSIELAPESEWNVRGCSRVVFEAATNPGGTLGQLSKIASGGELARFMLALKVVLAATAPPCTMIFDEVDAGISGATADAVGERLARLATRVQIFVVTHSPQVAARAAHHWRVTKRSRGGSTTTRLEAVAASSRREEIARMLSGASITDESRAAAESLLNGPPA